MRLAAVVASINVIAVLAWVSVLAGCALSPVELIDQGYRYDFSSTRPPRVVASCMATNMENHQDGAMTVSVREREQSGTYQVLWTAPSYVVTLGLIVVEPASRGSNVTMHLYPGVRSIYDQRAADIIKGC